MLGTAIFGAEQVIRARLGGAKPCHGVTAGQDVLLDAESGHIETMDRVLRRHNHLHVAAYRNVQFIDLALAFGVLQLPHPLLSHDVDFRGVAGWSALLEIDHRAPEKNHQEHAHGDNRPGQFQGRGTFDLLCLYSGTMAKLSREKDNADKNQKRYQPADDEQEDVKRIHIARHGGGALRPQWKIIEHTLPALLLTETSFSSRLSVPAGT